MSFFYPLKDSSLRKRDIKEGIETLLSGRVTMSQKTSKFENYFKNKLSLKNAIMVNSGSSANLLAFQCLVNPYRKKRLKPGDQVLLPALCWSTTLWPIVQSGLKPIFVDIDVNTFNISLNDLKKKITKKTKALMLVHVLGNSANMDELMKIVKRNNLILIEDTCESLGSKFSNKHLGSFGDFSTFSFYYTHQISSIEGGMISCKTRQDLDILKSLRSHGWARGLSNQRKIEQKNKNISRHFLFYNSGYNLRPTDVQAAIGLSQFKSLNYFIKKRSNNRHKIISSLMNDYRWSSQVRFLKENYKVKASWFGIPMVLNKKYLHTKNKILNKMSNGGIENRPIISGNFTLQPSVKKYNLIKKGVRFNNVNLIHKLGFFIGLSVNQINEKKLNRFKNIFFNSFNKL